MSCLLNWSSHSFCSSPSSLRLELLVLKPSECSNYCKSVDSIITSVINRKGGGTPKCESASVGHARHTARLAAPSWTRLWESEGLELATFNFSWDPPDPSLGQKFLWDLGRRGAPHVSKSASVWHTRHTTRLATTSWRRLCVSLGLELAPFNFSWHPPRSFSRPKIPSGLWKGGKLLCVNRRRWDLLAILLDSKRPAEHFYADLEGWTLLL